MEHFEAHHRPGQFADKQGDVDVGQTRQIGAALVYHNLLRQTIVPNRAVEESRCCRFITGFAQHEINGVAVFVRKLTETLSGNHSVSTVDIIASLNRQLAGWAAFYKFTDFRAYVFRRIDHVVFWKMAHWLGHKYRCRINSLMRKWFRAPEAGEAKTWLVYGRNEQSEAIGKDLQRLVSSPKAQFRWRNPEVNPYIFRSENRSTVTSRYNDVAMAMGQV